MARSKLHITSLDDRIVDTLVYVLGTLITVIAAYPLIFVLSASFSEPSSVITGKVVLWPVNFTVEGYKTILEYAGIWTGYRNTIFYTVVGTLNNLFMTMICAYPLSRRGLPGRKGLMLFFVFTMYFSGGMIPSYLLMRSLGYINTVWAIIVPGSFSVYQMIVARTFINSTIPEELFEAATIDGCSDFRYFQTFVVPLSKAIITVMTLQYAVGHWNDYWKGMIYLNDQKLYPLQLILRGILTLDQIDFSLLTDYEEILRLQSRKELIKYGIIIVSTVPMLVIYPFLQKYFVKGVMIGSLKG